MSLNKTRKRAIAKARRRLTSRVMANTSKSLLETSEQFLFLGYTAEQITEAMRSLGRIARAVSDGLVAFGKEFRESMTKQ